MGKLLKHEEIREKIQSVARKPKCVRLEITVTGKCLMKYRRFEEKYMFKKKSWKVCICGSLRDNSAELQK